MTTTLPKPAFNPWPWSLVAFFAVFISAVIGVGIFAARQNNDLVQPDYYEQEVRFQQQIDRVQRTQEIAREVTITYLPSTQQIRWALPGSHTARHVTGTAHFYRPSEARLDFDLPITLDATGAQSVDAGKLREGLWQVRLTWKVEGQEFYHHETLVLPPAPR